MAVRDDERRLARIALLLCDAYNDGGRGVGLGDVARWAGWQLGIPEKRLYYLLDKWAERYWIEYGVSIRSPWLTPEGLGPLREMAEEGPVRRAEPREYPHPEPGITVIRYVGE